MFTVACVWLEGLFIPYFVHIAHYHVARDGTIVPRTVQFVYHMCILRLVDVLRTQTKFASPLNCQK